MFDLKKVTENLIRGGILRSDSGVDMYTPDGVGHYPALWTRDFAYMVEYAGDLMDKEKIEKCIEYLLNGVDENGWIPDRVQADGKSCYTAGGLIFRVHQILIMAVFLLW